MKDTSYKKPSQNSYHNAMLYVLIMFLSYEKVLGNDT